MWAIVDDLEGNQGLIRLGNWVGAVHDMLGGKQAPLGISKRKKYKAKRIDQDEGRWEPGQREARIEIHETEYGGYGDGHGAERKQRGRVRVKSKAV